MQFIKYFGAISVGVALLASSCSSVQTIQQESFQSMPESFDTTKDATNSADINWKQFSNDKNLITLIDTALKNNWDVMIALQRIKAAQSDVLLSKGALKPIVNGSGGAGIRKFGLYTMDGAGNITTEIYNGKIIPTHLPDYFIGLQTSWELDIWGKLRNKRQAAAARLLASTEGRNLVITNLITEISIAYYELLALDNQLAIIDESIALQENAFKIVKVQKEAAAANELAVRQFEAQLLNLRSMKKEVLQQIAENENKINSLCGRFPQPIARDKSSLTQFLPPQFKVGVPSALLQNIPDIRQAEL
jgi:outer membrane protein, multidrug efflux system